MNETESELVKACRGAAESMMACQKFLMEWAEDNKDLLVKLYKEQQAKESEAK